ncbi:AAA family ATPase, partial [Acinetobacter baumannii]
VPVRLIVLETLSASGLLADENSNSEAAEAMAALAQIGRNLNALVLVTHHPPKNGGGERGASAIRGSADYVLEIIREDRGSIRDLELTKARNAP